jgi:hypothetical protein
MDNFQNYKNTQNKSKQLMDLSGFAHVNRSEVSFRIVFE